MIRVVLGTNVVVSALISPFGNESLIIHAVQIGRVVPCYSRAIADEYAGVLARPKFNFPPDVIHGLLSLFTSTGQLVVPRRKKRLSPDPKQRFHRLRHNCQCRFPGHRQQTAFPRGFL